MKGRLMGAQKGHSLLKKKADALQMRFRLILGKIIQVQLNILNNMLLICFFLLELTYINYLRTMVQSEFVETIILEAIAIQS